MNKNKVLVESYATDIALAEAQGRKFNIMLWYQRTMVKAPDGVYRFGCAVQIDYLDGNVIQFWGKSWYNLQMQLESERKLRLCKPFHTLVVIVK